MAGASFPSAGTMGLRTRGRRKYEGTRTSYSYLVLGETWSKIWSFYLLFDWFAKTKDTEYLSLQYGTLPKHFYDMPPSAARSGLNEQNAAKPALFVATS